MDITDGGVTIGEENFHGLQPIHPDVAAADQAPAFNPAPINALIDQADLLMRFANNPANIQQSLRDQLQGLLEQMRELYPNIYQMGGNIYLHARLRRAIDDLQRFLFPAFTFSPDSSTHFRC
jgi:hypothetical protein